MKWEPPAFVEINMSAEIGGYERALERPRGARGEPDAGAHGAVDIRRHDRRIGLFDLRFFPGHEPEQIDAIGPDIHHRPPGIYSRPRYFERVCS